ncbi:alpha/beta hydrolase [Galbibacter mesophilus]|uniref:alpha/beta hydrolase n=1 Tax=Galbibacter mesophilus TaxID=379069 RepID=UPI00191EDE41|nr:alpha/beta hydrolase [Galbibacter mesophilus]MCM5664072.1 alpha/beta hydrolase [Galbibacter mesophilus]
MLKIILKIFKWIGIIFAGLFVLLLISGAFFRLFSSKPFPPGKLVDVDGTKLHIRVDGEKNNLPTLVLESGAGGDTDVFHWMVAGLKEHFRIVRYDREGKWFSESSKDNFTPELYARQLHKLLEKSGEKPPYILGGHSMGGPYNLIYRDLYPNEVSGMVFLDSSHPEQWERLEENGLLNESQIGSIKFMAILADMGMLGIYNAMMNPNSMDKNLPGDSKKRKMELLTYSGEVYRRMLKESQINDNILLRAAKVNKLDSLPVLVFTATEQFGDSKIWFEMQKELKALSSEGKHFYIDANHGSILTKRENAEKINEEILLMAKSIK